ncbi:glycosyl transferase [Ochrobactrum sp. POC9]|uniref:glycosyltransferase family 2 protein n=1 Tax=unclassified Ochrobactrum TaxID=239106 RepID=UPI000D70567C|nr:glycosyltransferase [Ochrobactrum sp. POC9]MCH4542024.1 glycosyltransferase [Ochrobactrum sp. A-1]PWU74016.1 glycosyl transferase [Ochrobactrum sp. POC9]
MDRCPQQQPTVDVVIPNFNYGRYLSTCANSVLRQSGANVRLLIIDNASTDNSVEVAKSLAASDSRVELLLRRKNLGPHASFNEGIDWATSEYFLILCSDDLLANGALERATSVLSQCVNVHLAHGATGRIRADDGEPGLTTPVAAPDDWRIWSGDEFIEFACRHAFNPIIGPTAVVRTAIQKEVGYYRTSLSHTDDLEMWLRIALRGSIASTSQIQAYARSHPQNQSATVNGILSWNREFEAGFRSFFDHEGASLPDQRLLFAMVQDCLTKRAYWSAISNLARQPKVAGSLMAFALKREPLLAVMPPFDYLLKRSAWRNRRDAG